MTRRIQEGDHALAGFNMVRTDMLGDAAGLAGRHPGGTNMVEQRGLAMIDMAHHGHHRRTRLGRGVGMRFGIDEEGFRIVELGGDRLMAHVFNHDHRGVLIQHLVDGDHLAHLHQGLDHFGGLDRHLVRQIAHRDGFRYVDFAHRRFGRRHEGRLIVVRVPALAVTALLRATPTGCPADIPAGLDRALLGRVVTLPGDRAEHGSLGRLLGRFLVVTRLGSRFVKSTGGQGRSPGCGSRRSRSRLFSRKLVSNNFFRGDAFAFLLGQHVGRLHLAQRLITLGLRLADTPLVLVDHREWRDGSLGDWRRRFFIARCDRFRYELGFGFRFGFRLLHRFGFRYGRFDDRRHLQRQWIGNRVRQRRDSRGVLCLGCRISIACKRIGHRIALHQHTLLAHFDLNGARLARRVGLLDLGSLLARKRDLLFLGRSRAVALAQVIKQARLVSLGQCRIRVIVQDAGRGQLQDQCRYRHFKF